MRPWGYLDLRNRHRLRFSFDWYDNEHLIVSLRYGNEWGDPVWIVALEDVRAGPRLARFADRWIARDRRRRERRLGKKIRGRR